MFMEKYVVPVFPGRLHSSLPKAIFTGALTRHTRVIPVGQVIFETDFTSSGRIVLYVTRTGVTLSWHPVNYTPLSKTRVLHGSTDLSL